MVMQHAIKQTFSFKDKKHVLPSWPVWLDTVGLDESGAQKGNGELVNTRSDCPPRPTQHTQHTHIHTPEMNRPEDTRIFSFIYTL